MSTALAAIGVLGSIAIGLRFMVHYMITRDIDMRKLKLDKDITAKKDEVERAKQEYYDARDRALKSDDEPPSAG